MNTNAHDPKLLPPLAEANGFVRTLNGMGYMTSTLDEYSQEFIRFSSVAPGPSLDVGAAYGVATIEALRRGASVTANDVDLRHLQILENITPPELRSKLSLRAGAFPDGLDFQPESFGNILVCRVMHFFDGPTIERAAKTLHQWLVPSGKVFVVAETPYLRNFSSFIPVYEKRKKDGASWPGFIDDVMAIAPERGASLPPQIHFLDPDVLRRSFEKAGFVVEKTTMFARKDFPLDLQWDGRESVGLIARKV